MMSPDTEVALLLCGRFPNEDGLRPLSLGEWNKLAGWLRERGSRPADMHQAFSDGVDSSFPLDVERVKALMARGMAMSMALERWSQFGIWVLGRSDPGYPGLWRQRLKGACPAFIYGVGESSLLQEGGLAVVGSRDIAVEDLEFTQQLGSRCAAQHIPVVSGGAKGVDRAAMLGALGAGGCAVGVLANGLSKESTSRVWREALRDRRLVLVSSVSPDTGFHPGYAMGRNKLIYTLARAAVVVHSSDGTGGTWSGAVENLQAGWVPLYVRASEHAGNRALLAHGALPLPGRVLESDQALSTLFPSSNGASQNIASPGEMLFQAFLELLHTHLAAAPRSEEELGKTFDLEPIQLRYWLNLAQSTNDIVRLPDGKFRPVRESDESASSGQLTLAISG